MNKRIKLQDDFDDLLLLQSKFGRFIGKLASVPYFAVYNPHFFYSDGALQNLERII